MCSTNHSSKKQQQQMKILHLLEEAELKPLKVRKQLLEENKNTQALKENKNKKSWNTKKISSFNF